MAPPSTTTTVASKSIQPQMSLKPQASQLVAQTCARPIPNSYWATPLLLACEYPWSPYLTTQKLENLLTAGVRTFIDLTEHGELSPYAPHLSGQAARLGIDVRTVEYHCFPIRDRSLPESEEFMRAILDVLRDNAQRGRVSAVHCRGGIGRTGMVVGCWLVECGVACDGKEALECIAREWRGVAKCGRYPCSPETGAQFEFVKNWCRKAGAILSVGGDVKIECVVTHRVREVRDALLLVTFSGVVFFALWSFV
ncbi:hypothetical protein FIBSPDRAFT_859984 [Athelia psychrophila]|uniref:Tyrosine specific protein phosphatases domain-containing protein n=1 Tax=Athelia psychrophila TaxID=1759441 RepID=A0A166KNN0_9AGAM|nr:hypothetical protein FIBSPDRAFT_859979 [Fibularhizoctonia sp. CBS 109695]KZP22099.1 hypothetical protein FIBSPDRAFT_859984 [Fibularhizoctonia sp. CBS 109695]